MRSSAAAAATVLAAMIAIASTWTVFSATTDEPMHLSSGLQLYAEHRFAYQLENPPLPRAVMALAPWRAGMQFDSRRPLMEQLLRVFYEPPTYTRNLAVARAGNLVFFLIATLATWCWARREMGDLAGFIAVLLFALQPSVLGHSGVVTHDAAATAGVAVSLLAFARWLDRPTALQAMAFGAAYGFAIVCKFSCIPYVPAACLAMYVVRVIRDRNARRPYVALPVAALTAAAVIVVVYLGSLDTFIRGIKGLMDINAAGHSAYLFGEVSSAGWWWYFPVAIALKTTIGMLLLVVLGFFVARRERVFAESLAASAAILLVAMPSHLDLGIRYLLPLFVPLTIAATAVAVSLLRNARKPVRAIAVVLLTAHAGAAIAAHPDYIAYFNLFVPRDPSRALVDSNLEWGQDVLRLARVVRAEKVDSIGLSLHGIHDFDALGFPPHYAVQPWQPAHGWIAIGDHSYRMIRAQGGWWWLGGKKFRRVGKSIRLYYIP